MLSQLPVASLFLFAGAAVAKTCQNFSIPVNISARQGLFKTFPIDQNLDVTAFSQAFTRNGINYTQELLQGYQTVQGTYQISAQFCYPDDGMKGSTIQLLSHGIGFDKTYWDLSYNDYNYSYINTAIASGYSTLAIDRLGIGNSSHADALNVIQAVAEVEALNSVTIQLRQGVIPQIGQKFDKIIHIGHSFGSAQTYWLSALYPDNTDGIVLTGYSANASFLPTTVAAWDLHSARLNQPLRFGNSSNMEVLKAFGSMISGSDIISAVETILNSVGIDLSSEDLWNEIATTEVFNLINGFNYSVSALDYPPGYLATADFTADQFVFLLPGYYDLGLGVVVERTKQPVTTGELLTIGSSPKQSTFAGPVLIVTGQNDQPYCGGNCYATGMGMNSIPGLAKMQFPDASTFEAYVQPNTGHGINAHYNATAAYEVIQQFLGDNGLGA